MMAFGTYVSLHGIITTFIFVIVFIFLVSESMKIIVIVEFDPHNAFRSNDFYNTICYREALFLNFLTIFDFCMYDFIV